MVFDSKSMNLLVPKKLRFKIMYLEWAMMNMRCRVTAHEEGVMVHVVVATINVCEESNISLFTILIFYIQPVWQYKIEFRR